MLHVTSRSAWTVAFTEGEDDPYICATIILWPVVDDVLCIMSRLGELQLHESMSLQHDSTETLMVG